MKRSVKSHLPLPPVVSHLYARPRLALGLLAGLVLFPFLPRDWDIWTRALCSWDGAALMYLIFAFVSMGNADPATMRKRAAMQDDGKTAILAFTILTAVASLAAIIHNLGEVKSMPSGQQGWPVALAAATVLLSWLFVHTMFAVHYAHDWYGDKGDPATEGLDFPGDDKNPDYWDFIHFSYIIGCAAQTADIDITSKLVRRLATVHCVVAFFFNTTVLALTVNIGASLMN